MHQHHHPAAPSQPRTPARRTSLADEENFRLITGFNDIFVVIACLLLLIAAVWLAWEVKPWLAGMLGAALSWGLAEFFVRRRRMALPAIVLLLTFVMSFALSVIAIANGAQTFDLNRLQDGGTIGAIGVFSALAAWLHWRRFKVPITVAAGASALAGCVAELLALWLPETLVMFTSGAGLLAWALYWDARDPQRKTRRADVAFWLHMAAAPLIVNPLFTVIGIFESDASAGVTLLALAVYLVLAMISLIIDRRALMVSALGYVLYALISLISKGDFNGSSFALCALLMGGSLVLLAAFWQQSRGALVRRLPDTLQKYLPPMVNA